MGTEIAGYRIEGVIGRGGMGVVYLAEQASPRRKVALKVLGQDLAADPSFRERFVRESDAAASIEHPNIVPIYQAGEADRVLFIAMRYVEGTDLRALLERDGPLPAERAASIVSQVASALDAAHEAGLVHRDVKPGNVLVGKGDHAYLTDFGLIKRHERATSLTKTGQFMGTIDYVAPEQVRGGTVDGRADVYSLGCLLYECLTGKPPFPSDLEVTVLYAHLEEPPPSVTTRRPELPPAVDQVVAKAMAKKAEDRYQSAGELAGAARDALATPRQSEPAPPAAAPRRNVRLLVASGGLAALALVVLGLLLSRHHGSPGAAPSHSPSTPATTTAPPLNSVVEIEPSGKILHTIRHPSVGAVPQIAIGEGGVWLLGFPNLVHVDERTATVRAVIPTQSGPAVGAALGVGYQSVWVPALNAVQVFDPATDRPVANLGFLSLGSPSTLAVGDGFVWVGFGDGTLIRLDPGSRTRVGDVSVGGSIDGIAIDRSAVWTMDRLHNTISRIDPHSSKVTLTAQVGGNLKGIAVGSGSVWVLDSSSGTVVPIDPETGAVHAAIRVGNDPAAIAVGLGAVWVTDNTDGRIYRIDPSTHDVSTIDLGSPLSAIGIDQPAGTIWVSVAKSPASR